MSWVNRVPPVKSYTYKKSEPQLRWVDDDTFEVYTRHYQSEIDNYEGLDYKSLIEKNIELSNPEKLVYADTTVWSNKSVSEKVAMLSNATKILKEQDASVINRAKNEIKDERDELKQTQIDLEKKQMEESK